MVLPKRQHSDFYVFLASQTWIYLDYKTFILFTTNELLTLQRKCKETLCFLPCPPFPNACVSFCCRHCYPITKPGVNKPVWPTGRWSWNVLPCCYGENDVIYITLERMTEISSEQTKIIICSSLLLEFYGIHWDVCDLYSCKVLSSWVPPALISRDLLSNCET